MRRALPTLNSEPETRNSSLNAPSSIIEESPLPVKPPNAFAIFRDRVKEQVKLEIQQRQLAEGGDEINFSTEIAQRWAGLSAEDREVYSQEASKLLAEWQQVIDQRVKGAHLPNA